ncbi:MAG: hypothetical protein H0T69_05865 [Thermoleophilaceae bacterium]|nr:hypothetical protein [Thermoleophilaceae bacterium]
MAVTANLGGLFEGAGVWTSPAFTVPVGEPITGATFEYDRQLDPGGLVDLQPKSTVTVKLVDQTAGSTTTLLAEELSSSATSFAKRAAGAPAGAVTAGHSYQLRIETTTTSTVVGVGVVGQANTRFDNVVLAVEQGGSGDDGETTPIVSPGVTIVRGPLTDSEINRLFSRYNENTEVGRGPGGSLVPLAECTIIGTPGADRITGTRGNDVICGLGGNDVVNGVGGIDIVDGANGNDRLSGGAAKDMLIGLRGNDRLNGNAGSDRVGGGAGRDRASGAAGRDRLGGGSSKDVLSGAAGNDRLNGGKAADRLRGGRGADRLLGGAGPDLIGARDGVRDRVDGGKGRDRAIVDRGRRPRSGVRALRVVDRVTRVERRR